MADFGFVGPSYEAPSIYQDAQECINFFGEVDPNKPQGSRGYVALYPTPGLTSILQLNGDIYGNQSVRGMRALSGGNWLVAVVGPNVYAINTSYTATLIGTLTTTTGYVSITDNITSNNGLTAYIVDGANRYAWIAGTSTTVSLDYQVSNNKIYISQIPDGNIYFGLQIGSYGPISGFGTGDGGIGTYNLSNPITGVSVAVAGSSYSVGDVVTLYGGTTTSAATFTVSSINASGGITGLSLTSAGTYTAYPVNPALVSGGTGFNAEVNISLTNPILNTLGTVTGLAVTKAGTGFTALPILDIGSPNQSYGQIAIATSNSLTAVSPWDITIVAAGTGYLAGDILTVSGGTGTAMEILVTAVTGGTITGALGLTTGAYSAIPTNPVSVTGGNGSGATFDITLNTGGTGYVLGDVITASGGTATTNASFTVTQVNGSGVIEAVSLTAGGVYSVVPSNPVTMTGGTGSGAELDLFFGLNQDFTFSNVGSFYNSVPSITIEGGYGAAITATVIDYATGTQSLPAFVQFPSTDGFWQGANVCDVIDNYIIYNQPNTQNWGATDLGYSASNNQYYGTKDAAPDPLISIIVDHRQVFLLGQRTIEVWVDVGSTLSNVVTFPFQRVSGVMVQHGVAAPFSVARFADQFMFVSQDTRGQAIIGAMQGYNFTRLSTHAVEQTLLNQDISDAIAYTYQLEGHEFYVVTFPSIDLTWVFDLTTKSWHKWLSFDSVTGYHRHRSNCGALFNNQYIVGDFENGKLYQVDNSNYTEDGAMIRRLRRAPHIVTDLQRQYFNEMQIQFQPGVGLQTGQGQDPQAMLRWSNDGGSTWSNEHWTTIGKVGRYKNRAIWRRLGWSRDRIFEVALTDPVKTVIVSANLKAEEGDN